MKRFNISVGIVELCSEIKHEEFGVNLDLFFTDQQVFAVICHINKSDKTTSQILQI